MEHGIPLSRRASLVHIARISREEWRAVSGCCTCTLLHLESAIRWPGTAGDYDSKEPIFWTAVRMYPAVWISQACDHPRRCGLPPFRAIEFYESGTIEWRDWIRGHRLRSARNLTRWTRVVWPSARTTCRSPITRERVDRMRTYIRNPIKTDVCSSARVPIGKKEPDSRVVPGSQVRDTWPESRGGKSHVCVCYHFFHTCARIYTRDCCTVRIPTQFRHADVIHVWAYLHGRLVSSHRGSPSEI